MKSIEKKCEICGEETFHLVGKKLALKGRGKSHHQKRSTDLCTKCGRKEIINRKKGRRVIRGTNEMRIEVVNNG